MALETLAPAADTTGGDKLHLADGAYQIAANQIALVTRSPLRPETSDASANDHVITLLAPGSPDSALTDGRVDIRGSQGVRVTAGPGPLLPTESKSVRGVQIMVGEEQKVTIQRGLIPGVDQTVEMNPQGITINAGDGVITLKAFREIKLSVADGLASISLTPVGITIKGPLIRLN
jgi:hypothetical protein